MTTPNEPGERRSISRSIVRGLEEPGYAIVKGCLTADEVSRLISTIESATESWQSAAVRRRSEVYAVRNLLEVVPGLDAIFRVPRVRVVLRSAVGSRPYLTRAILFDKTASANWHVSWHQDLSVAVKSRADVADWTAWSLKAGIHHAQPPFEVMQHMVTLRIHLDPCQAEHGALRVIPGSHRFGRLAEAQVSELTRDVSPVICGASAGDALVLRPLILHSSNAATAIGHRRVLHFEFSPMAAPSPLEWRYQPINLEATSW